MESTVQAAHSQLDSQPHNFTRLYGAPDQFPKTLSERDFIHLVATTDVWERKHAYQRLVAAICANKLPPESLLPFIQYEPNAKLTYKATHQFIRRKSCSLADEFEGVQQVITLYNQGQIENAGAALAGLLSLGDRRVNALLRVLRSRFEQPTIHEFTRIHPSTLKAATIEFYFDWLFELQANGNLETLNTVCSSMTVMLFHDESGLVEDHSEIECVGFKKPKTSCTTFDHYFANLEPALMKLREYAANSNPAIEVMVNTWYDHRQSLTGKQ